MEKLYGFSNNYRNENKEKIKEIEADGWYEVRPKGSQKQ